MTYKSFQIAGLNDEKYMYVAHALSRALQRKANQHVFLLPEKNSEGDTVYCASTNKPFTKAEQAKVRIFFYGYLANKAWVPIIKWL